MKKLGFVLLLMLLASTALAQTQEPGLLSWRRLSLTAEANYYANQWQTYNNALARVTEHIRLSSFFLEPTGSYEKITGDATFRAKLAYRLRPRFALQVGARWGEIKAGFAFHPDANKLPESLQSVAHQQQFAFKHTALGIGVSLQQPLSKKFFIELTPEIARYGGTLNLTFRHSFAWRGPIPEDTGWHMAAELQQGVWGWHLGMSLRWQVGSMLSIIGGLDYRQVTFSDLHGPASLRLNQSPAEVFTAELVQASNYFGVGVRESSVQHGIPSLPSLTFLTEPGPATRMPAEIDLTSFGLRFGIRLGW